MGGLKDGGGRGATLSAPPIDGSEIENAIPGALLSAIRPRRQREVRHKTSG